MGILKENIQKSLFQSVAGKWVNVEVACAGMELELSKYPWYKENLWNLSRLILMMI